MADSLVGLGIAQSPANLHLSGTRSCDVRILAVVLCWKMCTVSRDNENPCLISQTYTTHHV